MQHHSSGCPLASVLPSCLSSFLAIAPAATRPMVSRADDRPPPATARMPYLASYVASACEGLQHNSSCYVHPKLPQLQRQAAVMSFIIAVHLEQDTIRTGLGRCHILSKIANNPQAMHNLT